MSWYCRKCKVLYRQNQGNRCPACNARLNETQSDNSYLDMGYHYSEDDFIPRDTESETGKETHAAPRITILREERTVLSETAAGAGRTTTGEKPAGAGRTTTGEKPTGEGRTTTGEKPTGEGQTAAGNGAAEGGRTAPEKLEIIRKAYEQSILDEGEKAKRELLQPVSEEEPSEILNRETETTGQESAKRTKETELKELENPEEKREDERKSRETLKKKKEQEQKRQERAEKLAERRKQHLAAMRQEKLPAERAGVQSRRVKEMLEQFDLQKPMVKNQKPKATQ